MRRLKGGGSEVFKYENDSGGVVSKSRKAGQGRIESHDPTDDELTIQSIDQVFGGAQLRVAISLDQHSQGHGVECKGNLYS